MTVLVCAPHPDDEMIGMGGTIAKLAEEGERVVVVIFTLGERSHPWQKKEAITEQRRTEALEAGTIAGTQETYFLELKDLSIHTEVVEKNTSAAFTKILKDEQPRMIFSPAIDDIHKDHRSVANFVLATTKQVLPKAPVWMYTVWNPLHIKYRKEPRLVVDISSTFRKKWKAINAYKSQKVSTYQLIPTVMLRGLTHGIKYGYHMAEVFQKAP